jgi:hypothetical protein
VYDLNGTYLCTTHAKSKYKTLQGLYKLKKYKNKAVGSLDFDDTKLKLLQKLEEKKNLLNADIVLIENQPSLKNPQMKSVQMILYSYFLIKGDNLKIEFISATNKLKILKNNDELNGMIDEIKLKTKNSYLQKKKISIAYCERLLNENDNYKNYLDFYKNNKKKDDLADSFLQCLYYVNNCL